MGQHAEVEYQKASDPTAAGYDGKVIAKRDGNDDFQMGSLVAGKTGYILDSSGRKLLTIDEATGELVSTRFDDGALGPIRSLVHDSASPAVDDVLGKLVFKGRDSNGDLYTGAEIRAIAKNVTAGAQEVWFEAGIMKAGSFVTSGLSLRVVGGVMKLYIDGSELSGGGQEILAPSNIYGGLGTALTTGSGSHIFFDGFILPDSDADAYVAAHFTIPSTWGNDLTAHIIWYNFDGTTTYQANRYWTARDADDTALDGNPNEAAFDFSTATTRDVEHDTFNFSRSGELFVCVGFKSRASNADKIVIQQIYLTEQ